MKILFSIFALLSVFTVYFFTGIQRFLIESNSSFTVSKGTPYLLLVLSGIGMMYCFTQGFKVKAKFTKAFLSLLLFSTPFLVGFILNPIYEGDFAKTGRKMNGSIKMEEFKGAQLVVLAIPGCPFCFGSIPLQKTLLKRNPSLKINFVVCSSDTNSTVAYIKEVGDANIKVSSSINAKKLGRIAGGTFPCFLLVKNGAVVYKWSNDQFGAGSIDQFERGIRK